MRFISTFASVVAVMWAASSCLRNVPRLGWSVPAYVVAQCLFALLALWGLQRTGFGHFYMVYFNVTFALVLFTAICAVASIWQPFKFYPQVLGIIGPLLSSGVTAAIVNWRLESLYPKGIPHYVLLTVLQGMVLSFCGNSALLSLFAPLKPAVRIAAMSLGMFWLLLGSFFLAYSVGIVHQHAATERLNQFVPMMLAIAAFSWMAFRLDGIQAEVSRQEVHAEQNLVLEV